eukprot:scaffold735_cov376-Prasinococcus_capsulatus_cf.AAC.19
MVVALRSTACVKMTCTWLRRCIFVFTHRHVWLSHPHVVSAVFSQPGDTVVVHWSGYTSGYQAKRIDNTSTRDEPFEFVLGSDEVPDSFTRQRHCLASPDLWAGVAGDRCL